jgi:aminoglycoside phosphotransferase (APT) family kinase protein
MVGAGQGAGVRGACETDGVDEISVVVSHRERTTLRVGDVFLKVDADEARLDIEVEAIGLVPVPAPTVLWHQPHVLALGAVPGRALGVLGEPSTASRAAWAAAGAAIRTLHEAPPPPWPLAHPERTRAELDEECAWLVAHDVASSAVVERNRQAAEAVFRPWTPVFAHGDLQITHIFVADDEVTAVIDWSEAGPGDPLFDIASLTLGHEERLGDFLAGYGGEVDLDVIRGWWSLRSLLNIRWLIEHGFDPAQPGCEIDVLLAAMP